MPPLKTLTIKKSSVTSNCENSCVKTMSTRSSKVLSNSSIKKENVIGPFPKRKAVSPIKGNTLKRSALGNITNAIETQCVINSAKKIVKKSVSTVTKPTIATTSKINHTVTSTKTVSTIISKSNQVLQPIQGNGAKSMLPPLPKSRLKSVAAPVITAPKLNLPVATVRTSSTKPVASTSTRPSTRQSPTAVKKVVSTKTVVPASKCRVTVKPKSMVCNVPSTRRSSRRSTLDSTDSSLYVSALSDVLDDEVSVVSPTSSLPQPEINIDEEYAKDPYQCATYAFDIFEYLKTREDYFKIKDYLLEKQPTLTAHIRAVLVDWMVELQENFEMNHETLYLGVKLVDAYLSKIQVSRQSLQLVGATALFIAAKYDERIPPAIEDFLYVCDGAYDRKAMTKMEVNILRVVKFELGFPLSYRFLRRYARCAKVPMPLLTLGRFILEYTLMDYSTVTLSDSKMAAAALYLAFKMKKEQQWDNTLIHFSGYRVKDFIDIAYTLNNSLHQKPRQSLATVRNKYSHKIFHEVAKIPLVCNEEL